VLFYIPMALYASLSLRGLGLVTKIEGLFDSLAKAPPRRLREAKKGYGDENAPVLLSHFSQKL